jgi:hypothetical protein
MAWFDSSKEQGFKDGQKSGDVDKAAESEFISGIVPGTQDYAKGYREGVESTKDKK